LKRVFQMFAAYNHWANERIYAAAADLTQAQLSADAGAFFGSMLGTLNHLLATDCIWMKRFTGQGQAPTVLNAMLFDALAPMAEARMAEDARIAAWIDTLDDATLAGNFSYTPISTPGLVTQGLASAMFHLFNHQTHHRGQCHMILTGFGRPSVTLDLVAFQRAFEDGRFL